MESAHSFIVLHSLPNTSRIAIAMADSLDSILLDYSTALDAAEAAVQDLLSLASCEVLDVEWSSKVARAKTRFTDQTRICKRSLCDLQFAAEDEDRCAVCMTNCWCKQRTGTICSVTMQK